MTKRALKSIFNDDPEILALIEARRYKENTSPVAISIPAKKPVKGEDYFTQVEIASFLKAVTPEKFKDYFTEEEIAWMMEQMQRTVFARITNELKAQLTPIKGKDYYDGVDGQDATQVDLDALIRVLLQKLPRPREINEEAFKKQLLTALITKIPTVDDLITEIKEKRLLNIRDINGARLDSPKGLQMNDQRWHGGGDIVEAGSGITITTNADGSKTISATGATIAEETPVGAVDGVNTVYTVSNAPLWIIADGTFRVEGQGYTYAAGTITMDALIPPVQFIRSYYSA